MKPQTILYSTLGILVGALILSYLMYNWGWDNRDLKADSDQKVAIEAVHKSYVGKVKKANDASTNLEQDKLELEIYNGKLEERIQAYINKPSNPNRSCLDDDGVQLFNSISEGRESSDTSELKRTLQRGFTEISRWQPKFYYHQPKRYLLPVQELS